MMKLKTTLKVGLLLLGLAACEPSDRYGEDLLTPCEEIEAKVTQIVLFDDVEDVDRFYKQYMKNKGLKVAEGYTRNGFCALRSNNTSTCYLPRLRGQDDKERMYIWGHEFSHVMCGPWHDENYTL